MKDEWQVLGRWEGPSPASEELQAVLCGEQEEAAAA
jgi:hypothetical protein